MLQNDFAQRVTKKLLLPDLVAEYEAINTQVVTNSASAGTEVLRPAFAACWCDLCECSLS